MPEDKMKGENTRKTLQIDVAKYQAMLDAPDATEEEKREFLEALWTIMMSFVDLGFELHPLSHPCGQLSGADTSNCAETQDVLGLEDILKQKFDEVATDNGARDGKESGHES